MKGLFWEITTCAKSQNIFFTKISLRKLLKELTHIFLVGNFNVYGKGSHFKLRIDKV